MNQGDIWYVNFSPAEGHEQQGLRPALIVSRNTLNRTGMCMVVPGTTKYKRRPARVALPAGEGGVAEPTYLICDQLRTVDKKRLVRWCGAVDRRYVKDVLAQVHYFLTPEPEA